MALGGGTFTTQNKVLAGSYINFVSAVNSNANLSDRGVVALAIEMDWGKDGEVFKVESNEIATNSLKLFGLEYTSEGMTGIRDLFLNAKTAYFYRLNSGNKATSAYGTAKYSGIRGNAIKVVVVVNADDENKKDVSTYMDNILVDTQTVGSASELADNDFIIWNKSSELEVTAGTLFTGGTNLAEVTGTQYQEFLDKIEAYSFNVLGCLSTTETIKKLYAQFTKRMRDEVGLKFQTVIYNLASDYEGIINVKNNVLNGPEQSLIYWITGASAGCEVNKSLTNKKYDGEFEISALYKQSELEEFIKKGYFVLHKVGDEIRVLDDINSYISFTVDKNEDFNSNQVIRVLDQIGNDIATIFNTKYLGKVQNNSNNREIFKSDIIAYNRELESIGAIENFAIDDVTVDIGNDKKSVTVENAVQPTCCMTKLYMKVIVS